MIAAPQHGPTGGHGVGDSLRLADRHWDHQAKEGVGSRWSFLVLGPQRIQLVVLFREVESNQHPHPTV